MKSDIWAFLGFQRATLRDLERGHENEAEKQPPPLKLAFPELNELPSGADNWRGQEPVERIVNAILVCAVRDGASAILIEPQTQNVMVRYNIAGQIREHLKLPTLALEPIVARFKHLARIEFPNETPQWGLIRLRVDERFYSLRLSTQATPWGERIELHFSEVTG